ncbi:MAG: translation elongation factor Ts [Planctomycetota bacterium]
MAITAALVKELREATGLGMMEAKKALDEVAGDFEKAIELARTKGLAKMDGRTDRDSAEGRVAVAIADDKAKGAIVLVNTETDFTANNDGFIAMTDTVAKAALAHEPGDIAQPDDAMRTAIDEVRLTTKENAQFAKGKVLGGAGKSVGGYVHHNGKVGALVELAGDGVTDELIKDLCMHVSAIVPAPIGLAEDDIPAETIDKEKEIAKQQAIEQGKPAEIAEKMVAGKMRKFYEERLLPRQKFVKDDKKAIQDILPNGVSITAFALFKVGG